MFQSIQAALATLPARFRWTVHNLFAHPVYEILWQLGFVAAAKWTHDVTIPLNVGPPRYGDAAVGGAQKD